MEFRNCTPSEMQSALVAANAMYDNNLRIDPEYKRGAYHTRLRAVRSGVIGTRTTPRGKRSVNASWEAHHDFLKALFDINPEAKVRTAFAYYKGKDVFYKLFPDTAYRNVGSQMYPCTMPDLTYEPEEVAPVVPIPREARQPFNAIVRKVRAAVVVRMLAGEFDDVENVAPLEGEALLNLLHEIAVRTEGLFVEFLPASVLMPLFAQRPRKVFGDVRRSYEISPADRRLASNINAARTAWEAQWRATRSEA